jgi:hypothetical protein
MSVAAVADAYECRCRICRLPAGKRREVEAALRSGMPVRETAKRFGVGRDGLGRHKLRHMPAIELAPAAEPEPIEDWQLRPMRCVRPFKTVDPGGNGLIDLQPGQILGGASLVKAQRIGASSCLAVMSDAELKAAQYQFSKFSNQTGPSPPPQRVVEPAGLLDGMNPDEVAAKVRVDPSLVDRQHMAAHRAWQASRNYQSFQQMDGAWRVFSTRANGTDWVGRFNCWKFAEKWFLDPSSRGQI